MINIDTQALPLVLLVAVDDTSGKCLPVSMLVSCAGQNFVELALLRGNVGASPAVTIPQRAALSVLFA